ncbi:MAG: MltA-interacting MipA family protein, partial [Candidatus Krumholzibacteria bacterium]|nr:MltA-interacting MipA family protein [Candidatus Krumholzibacteria bacterium]
MKKLLLIVLTGLLITGATAPALALGPLDIEAELPVYTKYVWRGMNLVDDAVLQPSLEVGLFGFELAVWGNMYLTDIANESGQFGEVDYTIGYELELALFELEAGFIFYTYP